MLDSNITLQVTGLIALADLPPITVRTTLSGTASYLGGLDTLVLGPGMHQQQSTSEINCGKYPITSTMTTSYVFRVENSTTVYYLQSIGITGHLITTRVYALGFVISRFINIVVIKWRNENEWKGKKEPSMQGDLFILLCHDRWVRLQGSVDDLKAMTSGQWLRDVTAMESFTITCVTMLVYGMPKQYERWLVLANELIAEMSWSDWAIDMGLVLPKSGEAGVVNV
ncbi:hypothetical protein ARMGADRAFT_1142777 [Armillaria gallica]|uniref:Uncharacterized protein n=1 Tax=Armillaria gallica TaxID=47427 RepID=A0A2H3DLG3_ARMGA|nr:hypothetical protein ARMGADRAFT_1142777 [Armillaria gallica]